MAGEYVSGIKFKEGDNIKGYRILQAFDPGGFAYAGKASAPGGRPVFLKKYKRPGAAAPWYDGFVAYQGELKRRIQADVDGARKLCYEFVEFFELNKPGGAVPLRAFYQVFEWVEGGTDLRGVLDKVRANPSAYAWNQRVIFARVMLAGINAIHKIGVIHSDLKPENFYLLPDATIAAKYKLRVIDMDFSIVEGKTAPWHGYEGYVGTPGYLSPEHLANKIPQKQSDVFTCGLILGELLGGAHPSADNMDDYDERAKHGRLNPVGVQQPIPEAPDLEFLSQVINGALRPELNKRPTAEQLLLALNGRLSEWDGKRPRAGSIVAPPPLPPRPAAPPTAAPRAAPPAPGSPPLPAPSRQSIAAGVEIVGPAGQSLPVNIASKFGQVHFKTWSPDFVRFMASEQFRLFKDAGGKWMIEHCATATNATTANGTPITAPIPITSGTVIAVGKTGKCALTLVLKG
jgi:serine/threonine protein kinase